MKKLFVLSLVIILSSCATIFNGPKASVTLDDKKVEGPINLTIDGKKYYNMILPAYVKIRRGFKATEVVAEAQGYKTSTLKINKKFNNTTLLNILMGGIPGITLDAITGSITKPEFKYYYLGMNPLDKNNTIKEVNNEIAKNNNNKNEIEKPKEKAYSIEELQALGVIGNKNQQPVQNVENKTSKPEKQERILSDVDKNIPVTTKKAENTFVLIIANEDYTFVDDVPFAKNDGNAFKEYCIKTLGVPEEQIWFYENASYGIMNSGINKMTTAMGLFDKSNAIIYYCGHGIPDEKTGDAYIIPTDGKGTDLTSCYSLNKLYNTIGDTDAENVIYFMDACFSGTNKEGSMLVAARGVAREPKKETVKGNTVVFSAASGDETAMAYKEKQHGLFTYYLLKKLQETKGDVNYGDLAEYVKDKVKKQSFLTNEKIQTPEVATSSAVQDNWKTMKF